MSRTTTLICSSATGEAGSITGEVSRLSRSFIAFGISVANQPLGERFVINAELLGGLQFAPPELLVGPSCVAALGLAHGNDLPGKRDSLRSLGIDDRCRQVPFGDDRPAAKQHGALDDMLQ